MGLPRAAVISTLLGGALGCIQARDLGSSSPGNLDAASGVTLQVDAAPDASLESPESGTDGPSSDADGQASPAPAAAAFGTLLLWLDANDPATITAQGDRVSMWSDRSGKGHHARQVGAAFQPRVVPEQGRHLLSFSGPTLLQIDDDAGLRPPGLTLLVVCRSRHAHAPVIGYPILASPGVLGEPFWQWVFFHAFDDTIHVRVRIDTGAGLLNTRWPTLNVYTHRPGRGDVYRNGRLMFDRNTAYTILYPPMGPGVHIAGFDFVGEIAEILIYEGSLDEAKRREAEAYLLAKWEIAPE